MSTAHFPGEVSALSALEAGLLVAGWQGSIWSLGSGEVSAGVPTELWRQVGEVCTMTVADGYVYVPVLRQDGGTAGSRLHVIDVREPDSPRLVAWLDTDLVASSVTTSDDRYLFVADEAGGFQVADKETLVTPTPTPTAQSVPGWVDRAYLPFAAPNPSSDPHALDFWASIPQRPTSLHSGPRRTTTPVTSVVMTDAGAADSSPDGEELSEAGCQF